MASLVQVEPENGAPIPLYKTEALIGRGRECDVKVVVGFVSRRHARLVETPDGWFVEDLGSCNGTFVNGIQVTRSRLRDGDFLKVGEVIFKFLTAPALPRPRSADRTWN